jgi:hypothetical protein
MNTRRVQNYGLLLCKRFLHICSPKTVPISPIDDSSTYTGYIRGAQILGARSPGPLNFVLRQVILVGLRKLLVTDAIALG